MRYDNNQITVWWMAKIPRDGVTPAEYKKLVATRIKSKREKLHLTYAYVADRLSEATGREIRADSYRKWETDAAVVQVDAILPLCDILKIHVYELLSKTSENTRP